MNVLALMNIAREDGALRLLLGLSLFFLVGCGSSLPSPSPARTPAPVAVVTSMPSATPLPPTATPTPLPPPAATPTVTLTPTVTPVPPTPDLAAVPGSVTGSICYPGTITPPMTLYVQNLAGGATELPVGLGQAAYTVEGLPPGHYVVYALTAGTNLAGLYSRAIPCGLRSACTDHSPLPFVVESGRVTDGIDLCDWYAPPQALPSGNGLVQMTTLQGMNLFAGPGLAYPGAGLAPALFTAPVTGRSSGGSWLQVVYPPASDNTAWIYSRLVRITGSLEKIPSVAAPPATGGELRPVLAESAGQFTPTRWSYTPNREIVHFKGTIRDERRNLVNGFSILADNGTWSVLSHPTGASRHYPDIGAGEWDIVMHNPTDAVGWWTLTVVRYDCPGFEEGFNAQCKQFTRLSEDRVVKVIYPDQTAITADWTCHQDCDQGLYVRPYRP